MKLLKLQASFGKLNDTMTLDGGLDLITAPNEAGKSTWTAFLIAMFYGIDTAERASKGNLPVKTKYKPWSGAPMQGTVELEWNGRRITLERRSTAKAPMSEFRAYETASGLPVPELSAENCGEVLLGAKREVFFRSALLRQLDLQVTKDAELEKKLASLVTTGDETASFYVAERKLRDLRNRICRAGTGILPQTKARHAEVERELSDIHLVQQSCIDLAASQKQLETKKNHLGEVLERIGRAEQIRKARRLREAQAQIAEQEKTVASLKELTGRLPDVSALHALKSRCRKAEDTLHTAEMEKLALPAAPASPSLPEWLEGRSEEKARAEAKQAQEEARGLQEAKEQNYLPFCVIAIVLTLGAAALGLFVHPAVYSLCAVFAALGVFFLARGRKQKKLHTERLKKAEAICSRYGVQTQEDIPAELARQLAVRREYEQDRDHYEQRVLATEQGIDEAQAQIDALLSEIAVFAPQAKTLPEAVEALMAAEHAHDAFLTEERALARSQQQLESLQQLVGDVPPESEKELEVLEDEHEVRAAYQQTVRDLQNATDQLNIARGRISAKADAVMLGAESEQLSNQIEALEKRSAAITLAYERLMQANDSLQARFSPQLSQLAGTYFGELTGGTYDRIFLDREMNIQVTRSDDPLQRPVQALSCGTADQLYFAVHLAMAELLLNPDCPLILDDALINFDDERAKRAIKLLLRQSAQRQVIVFSCHRREEDFLKAEAEQENCG
ncbi:MAG: AAA family ATPase [Clostridia bacterium]|nr:AAA family ATPase [Clostridia bacterium]